MQLLTLGLNHRTAPIDVRERVSFSREELRSGLMSLGEYDGLSGLVVLSTCNRTELYASVDDHECGGKALRQFLDDLAQGGDDLDEYLYTYVDDAAIQHLFRVASSLDSLVLGEGQILSQVKEAYAVAREAGTTSTVLNLLFHRAIATGKRVRTETRIAYRSVSVSYAAVELAAASLGGLGGCAALIFGAGKMAELTAEHLRAHGIETIFVANRHIERARRLAERIGGEAIPFDGAMEYATCVDVVVTSTGAPHYVIKAWEARRLMARRQGRKIFLIDIAVPRDVDPDVAGIKGIELYNIDALEAVVDEHLSERQAEAVKAEELVSEEVGSLLERFKYLSFQPLMALLSGRCERIREREIKRVSAKLPELSEDERRQVEHMSRMIVRKILRTPMMKIRASAGTKDEAFYIEAMRALFKLDAIGETGTSEQRHNHYRYAGK
ncbi:glutamyl-tRNA reductase [Selenomonas sp. oral taxon 892]|uniref:glutamyl-tRNA reductase n=1 Tax=Selenomonas sp. oral taxon 892 TaxID=1321785 RepID=UPI00040984B9|nr:glutamyl-tRNA reductase [Selenomonas sp. oral taxon 892]